jgi:hypothetical protein
MLGVAALLIALVPVTTVVDATYSAAHAAPITAAGCDPNYPDYCWYLEFYSEAGWVGEQQTLDEQEPGTCIDLTTPITRAGSMQNQLDQAVQLFDGPGCTGAFQRFGAGSYKRDLLGLSIGQVVSVKFIVDECRDDVIFRACLFADANYEGEYQAFPKQAVNACLPLRASLQGQVTSILNNLQDQTNNRRQDLLLFANVDCTGAAHRQNAWTGHPTLGSIGFDDKAKSVKFVVDPCVGQYICLWADNLYDGAVQLIGFQATGTCITLNAAVRGQVSSLRQNLYYPDQNVQLFTGDACTGTAKQINAGTAHAYLSDVGFDNQARSVRFLAQAT